MRLAIRKPLAWLAIPLLLALFQESPSQAYGEFTTQGLDVHQSRQWNHTRIDGTGVRVGIVDTGFAGLAALRGTELPETVQARCYNTQKGNGFSSDLIDCSNNEDPESFLNHGTLVAETLVDVAPGVTLYVSNPSTLSELQSAVEWMVSHRVSVINHSVTWGFHTPSDGSWNYSRSTESTVAAAIEDGVVWVNGAGNYGLQSWLGEPQFTDYGTYVEFLKFSGYDTLNAVELEAGDRILVDLRWNDDWEGAVHDLNLGLWDLNRLEYVAFSADHQQGSPGDFPIEYLQFNVLREGTYGIDVSLPVGATSRPEWVQLVVRGDVRRIEHFTSSGGVLHPAESSNPGLFAVGATYWGDPGTIEDYSSRGPTPDGRVKPDIVGAACGETSLTPLNEDGYGFCGTSQASPHVAGLATLVRQRFPDMGPVEAADYLKHHAQQRAEPDPNNIWGHGLAVMPPPLPPSGPDVVSSGTGPDWLEVTWSPFPDDGREPVTAWDLRYRYAEQFEGTQIDQVVLIEGVGGPDSPRHVIDTLLGSITYHIQVSGRNVWGRGEWSQELSVVTEPPVAPGVPTSLEAAFVEGEARVELSWQPPSSIGGSPLTGYHIQASPTGNDLWELVEVTGGNVTTYTDDGTDDKGLIFEVNNWPYYRVSATNEVGIGPFTEPAPSGDPLVVRYDTNKNGRIDRSEVIAAINDYLTGLGSITRSDVIRLINLYLSG